MAILFAAGRFKATDRANAPIPGAFLQFFQTLTSTPQPIWSDSALSVDLTNPAKADANGLFPEIWLDDSLPAYKVVFSSPNVNDPTVPGSVIWTIPQYNSTFTADWLFPLLNKRTPAEISNGVVPVNFKYLAPNILRYGPDGTGDFTTAIANASLCNGSVYFPRQIFPVSAQNALVTANVKFYGEGKGSVIQATSAGFHLFDVRANDITFEDLAFNGAAVDSSTGQFGIFTQQAYAPQRLKIYRCYFGGATSGARLNSAIKYDADCDDGRVIGCTIDRMMGVSNGVGYGVLAGAVNYLTCSLNKVLGDVGQGRHAFYLSTGAQYCVISENQTESLNFEHITMNATVSQAPNAYNTVIGNVCLGGVIGGGSTGQFSIFGWAIGNKIIGNTFKDSGDKGIFIEAFNATGGDCACSDNQIIGNTVVSAQTIGIDISGTTRTLIQGNFVKESSQAAAQASSNIRLISTAAVGGSQTVTDCKVIGNTSTGATFARSAFQINSTATAATGTVIKGNDFEVCNLTDVELGGVAVAIDGRLRGVTTWDPASIATAASTSTTFTLTGAVVGDQCSCSANVDLLGCQLTAVVSATDTVKLVLSNLTGSTQNVASGNFFVDVWKRTP